MDRLRTVQKLLADAEQHQGDDSWPHEPLKRKALRILDVIEPEHNAQPARQEKDLAAHTQHSEAPWAESWSNDPFTIADFDSNDVPQACEYEPAGARAFHYERGSREYVEVNDGDDNPRMSRRDWFELDQMLAQNDDWTSENSGVVEGESAQGMGKASRQSEDVASCVRHPSQNSYRQASNSSHSLTAVAGTSGSLHGPAETEPGSKGVEDELFNIALQRNLLNQGDRLEHFLDRCTWRVEDMIAQAKYTLASKPTRDEVEMYATLSPMRAEHAPSSETQHATTQTSLSGEEQNLEKFSYNAANQNLLMGDIDRLIEARNSRPGHIREKCNMTQRKRVASISQLPKPASHKSMKASMKAAVRSHLPIAIINFPP
ncbi:MAG: hypothetical protein Q9217_002754 [Psora testacea]